MVQGAVEGGEGGQEETASELLFCRPTIFLFSEWEFRTLKKRSVRN